MLTSPVQAQRVKLTVPLDTLIAHAQRDSNDAPAHYEVALGYWVNRKYDDAEKHLREAISIDPSMAEAYLALGFLPYARNSGLWDDVEKGKVSAEWLPKVEEAWHLRQRAYLLDPLVDLQPLALMIPPTGTFGMSRRQSELYTYVMNGFGAFWTGQYDQAYAFFSELTQGATPEDRKNFEDWFLWYEGLTAAHTFRYPQAAEDFQTLLTRAEARERPDSGVLVPFVEANDFRYTLATIKSKAGQVPEALKLFQDVLTSDLGMYEAHVRLAEMYEAQHRTQSALQERQRALETNPDDPALLLDLGEAMAKAGDLSDAYGYLEKAVAANPRSAKALYLFASVAQKLDQRDAAKVAYTHFIAMAPSVYSSQIAEARERLQALQ
jgi:tetratricopeptide (TPR) repeat protein